MSHVIEFQTDLLVKVTKQLWHQHKHKLSSHDGDTAYLDGIKVSSDLFKDIPWLSGIVGFISISPNSKCPIHLDIHEGSNYSKSLNILVESDGDNHSTSYYEFLGDYKVSSLFDGDPDDLEKVFEFTVKHPTMFHNQIFHDVNNYGNKRRVMALWLIDNSVTEDAILDWAKNNNITTNKLF